MKNFISVDKMTKKQKKAYYAKQRNTWNGLNPATRTVPNGKGYNRNKQKQEFRKGIYSHGGDAPQREYMPFVVAGTGLLARRRAKSPVPATVYL